MCSFVGDATEAPVVMTPEPPLEPIAQQEVQGSNSAIEPTAETTESYLPNQIQEDNPQLPTENQFQNIPEQQDPYQAPIEQPSQDNQFQEPYQDQANQPPYPNTYQEPVTEQPYQDPYQQPQQEPYQNPYQEQEVKDPYVDPGMTTETEYGNQESEEDQGLLLHYLEYAKMFVSLTIH